MPHLTPGRATFSFEERREQSPGLTLSAILVAVFITFSHFGTPSLSASELQTRTIPDVVSALREVWSSAENTGGPPREQHIKEIYNASPLSKLNDKTRERLSDEDARLVFEAANIATFYALDQAFAHDQVDAFKDLERRGIATKPQATDTLKSLISVRDFVGAEQFSKSHPNAALPPVPSLVPLRPNDAAASGSRELVVGAKGRTLSLQSGAIGKRTMILVVSHPLCHFTQHAARAIEADPVLSKLFIEHSKWLAPQARDLDFSIFSNWNVQHPALPITIAYQKSEWAALTDWATPIFYFIRDGQVVSKVVGWPKEGKKEALLEAAQQIGLDREVSQNR